MFDRIISAKIELSEKECYCGIQDFYDLVAEKLGYNKDVVRYDCTKINVARSVMNRICDFYKNEWGMEPETIGQIWLNYGPKANLLDRNYTVEVFRGFIQEVSE